LLPWVDGFLAVGFFAWVFFAFGLALDFAALAEPADLAVLPALGAVLALVLACVLAFVLAFVLGLACAVFCDDLAELAAIVLTPGADIVDFVNYLKDRYLPVFSVEEAQEMTLIRLMGRQFKGEGKLEPADFQTKRTYISKTAGP
jgi:hypothetical protein